MTNDIIYFDNAASMKPLPQAVQAFNSAISEHFSNPAALHKGGIEAEKLITAARATLCSYLPKSGTIVFTSGATESNNLALRNCVKPRFKRKIVTTAIEHKSVSSTLDSLGEYQIVRVSPLENIADYVDDDTAMVSMTAVCGETGYIVPICDFYEQIKGQHPDCIVHVDAAQSFRKNVGFCRTTVHAENPALNGDLISISAHKIGGIAGAGALFVKNSVRLNPMIFGGGQQGGIRSGTQPTALIHSFAKAAEYEHNAADLRDELVRGLDKLFMQINSVNNSLPNIVNFSCGVKSEIMLHFLATHQIYVSSGSACARGKKSEILPAFGVKDSDVDTAIRVSFGHGNTVGEVARFLEILEMGLKKWK
jgi:cysteine desulfurase